MRGVITNRDVVRHLGLIYREFGTRCVFRCLWVLATRRTTTFLDVVTHAPSTASDPRPRASGRTPPEDVVDVAEVLVEREAGRDPLGRHPLREPLS